jgi:hypothetical protein
MTTLDARQATQPLAGERLRGRVALGTGGTEGVGTAIGRGLVSGLGRRDGVHFLGAGGSLYVTGRVRALNARREM